MKKISAIVAVMCMMVSSFTPISAQEQQKNLQSAQQASAAQQTPTANQGEAAARPQMPMRPQRPNYDQMAIDNADQVREALDLDGKDFQKVVKAYKEYYEMSNQMVGGPRSASMGHRSSGPATRNQGRYGTMTTMSKNGNSARRQNRMSDKERKEMMDARMKQKEKALEKLNKTMKKILKEDQYVMWEAIRTQQFAPKKPRQQKFVAVAAPEDFVTLNYKTSISKGENPQAVDESENVAGDISVAVVPKEDGSKELKFKYQNAQWGSAKFYKTEENEGNTYDVFYITSPNGMTILMRYRADGKMLSVMCDRWENPERVYLIEE